MGAVTISKENYLKTILKIERERGRVRAAEIAAAMEVTRASVSHAVHWLEEEGYLCIQGGRDISLTPTGRAMAACILERYETFYRFFLSLGVPKDIASADAGRMEHAISDDSFHRMKGLVTQTAL